VVALVAEHDSDDRLHHVNGKAQRQVRPQRNADYRENIVFGEIRDTRDQQCKEGDRAMGTARDFGTDLPEPSLKITLPPMDETVAGEQLDQDRKGDKPEPAGHAKPDSGSDVKDGNGKPEEWKDRQEQKREWTVQPVRAGVHGSDGE
jgi:hypothetical protein